MNKSTRSRDNTNSNVHSDNDLSNAIGHKANRKLNARKRGHRNSWFGLGLFGLVGWSIAVPTLLGAWLGSWCDNRWPSSVSWTLTLLISGLFLGCFNAWIWIQEENKHD